MRIVILGSLLCICVSIWSQDSSHLEQVQEVSGSGASGKSYFCVPGVENKSRSRGVEIFYSVSGGGDIQVASEEPPTQISQMQSFEQFGLKIHIPVILKPALKVLLGYSYQPERFRYGSLSSELQPLVSHFQYQSLKSNAYSLTAAKSLNDHNYIGVRAKVAFNGDYDGWMNFESRYRTMNIIGLFGIKKNEDFEWGVGVYYTQNMRRALLLPFAMMHKTFNDKWGIELAPPAYVYGRYNINEKSMILFGGEYASRIYAFDTQKKNAQSLPIEYTLNHAEINAVVSLERQIVPWVWFNIKGGYQFSLRNRFETDELPDTKLYITPPNAPFFQMSLFLSPPDHMK